MSSIRCDIYDPSEWDIWFAAASYGAACKPAKMLKMWAAEEQADVVYNLCLFNMTGAGSDQYGVIRGRTLQYLRAKDVDCGYGGTAERLTVSPGNVVSSPSSSGSPRTARQPADLMTVPLRVNIPPPADKVTSVISLTQCGEKASSRRAATIS